MDVEKHEQNGTHENTGTMRTNGIHIGFSSAATLVVWATQKKTYELLPPDHARRAQDSLEDEGELADQWHHAGADTMPGPVQQPQSLHYKAAADSFLAYRLMQD